MHKRILVCFLCLTVYMVMINQRHRQTDRRTDDMRSQDRALHYSASRGNKMWGCTPSEEFVRYRPAVVHSQSAVSTHESSRVEFHVRKAQCFPEYRTYSKLRLLNRSYHLSRSRSSVQLDGISSAMIVWRTRAKIVKTDPCYMALWRTQSRQTTDDKAVRQKSGGGEVVD